MRLYIKFVAILSVAVTAQWLLTRYEATVYETIFCARVYLANRADDGAALDRLVNEYTARYRAVNGTLVDWEAFEVVRVRLVEEAAERERALLAAAPAGGAAAVPDDAGIDEDGMCVGPRPPATTTAAP